MSIGYLMHVSRGSLGIGSALYNVVCHSVCAYMHRYAACCRSRVNRRLPYYVISPLVFGLTIGSLPEAISPIVESWSLPAFFSTFFQFEVDIDTYHHH